MALYPYKCDANGYRQQHMALIVILFSVDGRSCEAMVVDPDT